MEDKQGILDLDVGRFFEGYLLVKEVNRGTAKNGTDYFRVTLGDVSGTLNSMVWGVKEEHEEIFQEDIIIYVEGDIGEYNGTKQLNLKRYRNIEEDDEIKMEDLLRVAPEDSKLLLKEIKGYVGEIENKNIKKLVVKTLNKHIKMFVKFPAAKNNHHNYVSGLIYHTVSMLRISKFLTEKYTFLSKDLMTGGIILHDLGKVIEYSSYTSPEFTLYGKFKGHISIINEELAKVAEQEETEGEELLLLQHIVLSHHGKREWGSPVEPQIIEAQMIHLIDGLDATLDTFYSAKKNVKEGDFTENLFTIGNRKFYIHGYN